MLLRSLVLGFLAIAVSLIVIQWCVAVAFYWLIIAFALVPTMGLGTVRAWALRAAIH